MRVKILKTSFGFDKGGKYPAKKQSGGYFVTNGSVGRFMSDSEVELVGGDL